MRGAGAGNERRLDGAHQGAEAPTGAAPERKMSDGSARMVFLGFGKWARADRIYALEPITGDERGGGRRTRVWIEGIADPVLAGRTERTILHDMGQDSAAATVVLDDALDLAERVAKAVDEGPLDLRDLGRRARRVLEKTAKPAEPEQLF